MAVAAFGFALIFSPAPASAAGEGPVTVPLPTSYFQFEAAQSPKVIGRRTWTPVSLHLSGRFVGDERGLGIKALTIALDRHLSLNAEELPTCNPRFRSRAICKRALIGEGTATILLASEDPAQAAPIDAHLALYNGGVRGSATHLYIEMRLPERWGDVVYLKASMHRVRESIFGSEMTIAVPPLVDGEGFLTSFDLAIESKLRVDGEDVPVLTAICPAGKIAVQGEAKFGGGEKSVTESVRACTPGPPPDPEHPKGRLLEEEIDDAYWEECEPAASYQVPILAHKVNCQRARINIERLYEKGQERRPGNAPYVKVNGFQCFLDHRYANPNANSPAPERPVTCRRADKVIKAAMP